MAAVLQDAARTECPRLRGAVLGGQIQPETYERAVRQCAATQQLEARGAEYAHLSAVGLAELLADCRGAQLVFRPWSIPVLPPQAAAQCPTLRADLRALTASVGSKDFALLTKARAAPSPFTQESVARAASARGVRGCDFTRAHGRAVGPRAGAATRARRRAGRR